jgi:serine/threonine protein kinase/tetratricopeptide (TPR) repeat protein
MTPEQFKKVEELFHRVVELSAEEREAFLDEHCPDGEIRAKVEQLLALDEKDGDPLETLKKGLLGGVGLGPPSPHSPGDRVGPYRLVRQIGEGGMGVVFEAEQDEPVRRRVALKLIKWGMDTAQVVARFESERQTLALMNHPNIARVYDAGATQEGRPYFVMELVEGRPVTKYCDAERLDTRARLELFLEVCDGVRHAHRKGVIHRDLKPSNILVASEDGKPVPKIIDFGVAKATEQRLTERTLYTELGQLVGTPEYMSPEQAGQTEGDIDTRTDVYALGVVLYELLVGALPFDPSALRKAGFEEILRRIREDQPSKPSTRVDTLGRQSADVAARRRTDPPSLRRQLRGDLDWIVMKALDKERERRYEGAFELSADLRRHLNHEPVLAGPPGAGYRLRRFVRRNRTLVAGLSGIVLALLAGVVVSTWFALGQARARAEAERRALESDAVLQFLEDDVLGAASPESSPDRELTVREALDAASATVAERFADQPSLQGSIHSSLGVTYGALGLFDRAASHFESAIDRYAVDPGREHPATAKAIGNLGELYRKQGRFEDAEPLLLEALELKRRLLAENDVSLAIAINNLGLMYRDWGRPENAEPLLDEALDLERRYRGEDDVGTLTAIHNLALVYEDLGRTEEALELFSRNLESWRRVVGEDHPFTLAAMQVLAVSYGKAGRVDEAVDLSRELVKRRRVVLGDHHPDTLISMSTLATALFREGRLEEAASLHAEAIEGARRVLPGHWRFAMMQSSYADCLVALERYNEAGAALIESHRLLEATLGRSDPRTAQVAEQLAVLYEARGRPDDASRWRTTLPSD